MLHWIALALRRSTDFRGRSQRKEFWIFSAALLVVIFALLVIVTAISPETDAAEDTRAKAILVGMVLLGLPQTALMARRLHDIGRSGWWMLVFGAPVVGMIVWGMWMATDGQPRPNRYGPDPKGRGGDHPAFTPPAVRPAAMPRL